MIKKILSTLLISILILPIIGSFDHYTINADGNAFTVAHINDDCDFDTVGTYGDYNSAYNKMKELGGDIGDYVVLSNGSLSPMKIVAMNRGLVFSYPYRSGNNTQYIYSELDGLNGNKNKARTYVAAHYEMSYKGTKAFYVKGEHGINYDHGWVKVVLNGFEGYTDLEYVDLVPMKLIENGIEVRLGGNSKGSYSYPQVEFGVVAKQHYYYVKKDGNYNDLHLVCYENWDYNGNQPLKNDISYGVAPSFMKENKNYYSEDGINFYADRDLKEFVGTYYNYYQFVPARTKSNITASTINSYISIGANSTSVMLNTGKNFTDNQSKYGVNGALVAAMGIHESGWGNSNISGDKFNLFGWGAFDSDTSKATRYSSVSECIASQMGDNLANYLDHNHTAFYSLSLGNKGGGFITSYASDPYWAEKISHYYYGLDKQNNNKNGKLTDYNSYVLALVNSNTAVKRAASTSSSTIFNTANVYGYQKNMIYTVLGVENGFAKVQLSNPVLEDGSICYPFADLSKGTKIEYSFDRSVGYISVDNLTYLNGNPEVNDNRNVDSKNLSLVSSVRSISFDNNKLNVKGVGAITGLNFTYKTDVKHQLVLVDYKDESNNLVFDINTIDSNGYDLNDGYDYKYTGFDASIDLKDLPLGNYGLMIKVINGQYSFEKYLSSVRANYNSIQFLNNDVNYHLSCNQLYSYRIELDVASTSIDFSTINKGTTRKSSLTLERNAISLDEEGNIEIGGHGFIFYLDYSDDANVNYKVRLINSMTNELALDTETINVADLEYAKNLGIDNNLDNIRFLGKGNVKDLDDGIYYVYVENSLVNEGENYLDIIELTNTIKAELPSSVVVNNKSISFITDVVRNRLAIKIESIGE